MRCATTQRTGRWEAHIWHTGKQVSVCCVGRELSPTKSRPLCLQLHLGSFRHVEDAAHAYDKAAIKLRGWNAEMNFPSASYKDDTVLADNLDGLSSNEVRTCIVSFFILFNHRSYLSLPVAVCAVAASHGQGG
jgi:hypothetical protein